ncbi:hypothetical protein [Myroides odoratimimus]|uniref:hypothetical protein n=1 Tax=Myroides odoratimimus TaxID=76832 RepID=UPI0025772C12|nr:hypothetical protein [Myroides odoratimimus]MDM1513597.1 hypothetical protein [Myroides odoratimimus]
MTATELRRLFRAIVGDMWNLPLSGTVTVINGEMCSVKLVSGLEVSDVRLKATVTEGKNKVLLTPVVGSDVIIMSSTGTLDNLFVLSMNEVDKVEIINSDVSITIDDKVSVEVSGVSLGETMANLCDAIKTLTVSTGVGPSGTPLPPTQQKVQQLEKDFKTVFK